MKRQIFRIALLLILLGYSTIQAQISLKKATRMEVDKRYDPAVDASMQKKMDTYTAQLEKVVSRKIGFCSLYMDAKSPESYLSNFLSDQLLLKARELDPQGADFAVLNMGSIRAPLYPGDLTVGDIYRVMPFENELVILELKASDVLSLFENLAKKGGEGVSNVKLEITNAKMANLLIGGLPLEKDRLYRVATMDYLADGNSGMVAFRNAVRCLATGLKVRDVYIGQIEKLTAKGLEVSAELDERIKYVNK
jgi:2',3'-cyclic-nucleotide 2'-phosphodiesterase (5'-nucleotidase family)